MYTSKMFTKCQKQSKGLPLIHCKCGMDILVVPDVKAMDRAIERHLGTCPIVKRVNTVNEKTKCSDYLIKQILDIAALEDGQEKEQQTKRTLLRGDAAPIP